MSLVKQFLQFTFGSVSQDAGSKHIQPGGLLRASNCIRGVSSASKRGPLTKRKGFSRQVPTFTGASWTNNAEALLPGNGTVLLARDGSGRKWAYDPDVPTFRDRGTVGVRAYAGSRVVFPVSVRSETMCEVGNNTWFFAQANSGAGAATTTAYYAVVDTTTGIVIQQPTSFTISSSLGAFTCAYDNSTNVWVFDGTSSYKFVAATPTTAPTTAAFAIGLAGGSYSGQVSARYLSNPAKIAVVGTGFVANNATVAYLDTATGGKAAAPAPVNLALALPLGGALVYGHCRILVSDGTTSWYFAYVGLDVTGGSDAWEYHLVTVTTATLAMGTDVLLGTAQLVVGPAPTEISFNHGGLSGYVDTGSGDRVVFATDYPETQNSVAFATCGSVVGRIRKFVRSGATTDTVICTGAWVASDPFLYNGNWYFLSGFHDIALAGGTVGGAATTFSGLGCCLHLRNSSGHVLNQIRYGDGPRYGNLDRTDYPTTAPAGGGLYTQVHICNVFVSGSVGYVGSMLIEPQRGLSGALVTLDFATTWPSSESLGVDTGIDPGPIVSTWGRSDSTHEAGVLTSPCIAVRTAGAGATYTSIGLVYSIVDSDGTIWRSSPYTGTLTFGAGDTLKIPTPILLPGSTGYIEIYGGTTTLRLLSSVKVDATVSVQSIVLFVSVVSGETLYTTGGGLSNSPPFQARDVYQWRNRVFCVGSDFDDTIVRYSLEREFGFGPRFNEILSFYWREGTGAITGMGAVDWNFLAFFKRDAIAVISGTGPDGRGGGNYVVQTLPVRRGCTNVNSIATGPGGVYFQDAPTGRICRLGSDLQIVEATPGADDWRTEAVSCAIHDEANGVMKFYTANRVIVLDYRHPSETQPLGEVFDWSSAGIPQAYAACVDNTGPVHMEAAGIIRRPETGETYQDATSGSAQSYGVSVESAWIQPFGLQSEFSLRGIQFLGEFRAAHTFNVTTYLDYSVSGETETLAVTASPEQYRCHPTGALRIQAFRLKFEETSSTAQGFDLEGFGANVQNRGKNRPLNTTQRI